MKNKDTANGLERGSERDDLKPIDFNLTETNQQLTRTGRFNAPTPKNEATKDMARYEAEPHPKMASNPPASDPTRKSLLVEAADREYEQKRNLVKSILQKLEKGNIYQKANDLLDSAVIMYSKQLDKEASKALGQLEDMLLSFDEKLSVAQMERKVKEAFGCMRDSDTGGVRDALIKLERLFVLDMYEFLPQYLDKFKSLQFGGTGTNNPALSHLAEPIELTRLKQDNEKLKKDVKFLKEQKSSLEKLIE